MTDADGAFELLVPPGDYLLRLLSSDEQVVKERPLEVQSDIRSLQLQDVLD